MNVEKRQIPDVSAFGDSVKRTRIQPVRGLLFWIKQSQRFFDR